MDPDVKYLASLADVLEERRQQRAEFGEEFDNTLGPAEWVVRLTKHLGRAVSEDPATYRKQLVIVGALALAALEAHDRMFGETP